MKRIFALVLLLGCCLAIPSVATAQASAEPQSGFVPRWQVGQQWMLEASYRDLKNEGEPWLPPVRWIFKVKALKNLHQKDCYVVYAFPKDQHVKMQAVLYLGVDDLRPLRVIDIFPGPRGVQHRIRDFDPSTTTPLVNEDTMVPYDLPVFPLVSATRQNADGFGAYAAPQAQNFAKVKTYGIFRFKKKIAQTGKQPEKQFADALGAYRSTGESFQVEMADPGSSGTMTQVWQESQPWAVMAESHGRKVRLVPSAAPTPLPVVPQGGNR